jgi:serine/threonine protein kinase
MGCGASSDASRQGPVSKPSSSTREVERHVARPSRASLAGREDPLTAPPPVGGGVASGKSEMPNNSSTLQLNSGAFDDFDVPSGSTTPRDAAMPHCAGSVELPQFSILPVLREANRPCAKCGTRNVSYECNQCDVVCCCDCIFELDAEHDPSHNLQLMESVSGSRLRGEESSVSMERTGSSFLYDPCKCCSSTLFDVDVVFRCDLCPEFIICEPCYTKDEQAAHEHPLNRFQRKAAADVKETRKKVKARDGDGNRCINDYIVVKELGRGAYAKVKLLQHVRTRELFAVKILKREPLVGSMARFRPQNNSARSTDDDSDPGSDDSLREKARNNLLREVAVMKLIEHKNLVKLVEVIDDEESEKVYVIMEFCKHGCLHRLGQPKLPTEKVRAYGHDMLMGLLHLHKNHLYHRDIKPENVLIDADDVAKLADFGTCDARNKKQATDGTPAFHSPEMLRGEAPSGLVLDSWAFGVTMFQAALGVLPFPIHTHQALLDAVLSSDPVAMPDDPSIDKDLVDILSRLLIKDVNARAKIPDAARHPFFRFRERGVLIGDDSSSYSPNSSPNRLSVTNGRPEYRNSDAEQKAVNQLYEKAMTFVRRGRRIQDSFYGLEGVKRARQFSLMYALHSAFPDGSTSENASSGADFTPESSRNTDCENSTDVIPTLDLPQSIRNKSEGAKLEQPPTFSTEKRASGSHSTMRSSGGKMKSEEIIKTLVASRSTNGKLVLETVPVRELPTLVEQATDIDHLLLRSNGLVSVGSVNFSCFSRLREVAIVSNALAEFPIALLAAKTLQRIDLSGNFLTSVPEELSQHPLLEQLSLNANRISVISNATPFSGRHFRHVRLSNNLLGSFPRGLEACASLELVLDDVPALVEEWTNKLIFQHKNVSVVWNDLFPTRVVPSLPLYLATKRVSLYTQNVIQVLRVRQVVASQKIIELNGPPTTPKMDFLCVSGLLSPGKLGAGRARKSMSTASAVPPLLGSRHISKVFRVSPGHGGEQICAFLQESIPEPSGTWQSDISESSVVVCLNEDEASASDVKEVLLGVSKFLMNRAPLCSNMTEADGVAFLTRACRGFYA